MDIVNELAGVDLNLLVALHALLEERSVTRAARRIGRSQPATSNALARLRVLLGDPLLVREGQVMLPTPRARALMGPVGEALRLVHGAMSPSPGFDPATDRRILRVAADDLAVASLIAPAMARIRQAPHVRLEIWPGQADPPVDALAAGELDLAIGVYLTPPATLGSTDLVRHGFTVLARADHPALTGGLDLDTYCALPHLIVSPRGATRSVVDYVLSTMGRTREVVCTVPQFHAVPALLAGSDLIATLPEVVAGTLDGLRRFTPPLALPRFPLRAVWHLHHDADPAVRWLRDALTPR